ncbi:hypothetical protein ACN47E_005901 [Coniothyrium glycines]
MSAHQAVRRWILTAGVTAITITGTLYGASLKGDHEVKVKAKEILQATPEERIAQLEVARADLVRRRNEMQRKIDGFKERVGKEEQEGKKEGR